MLWLPVTQGRIIQCAQCARVHEAPPHWRPTTKQTWKLSLVS